MERAKTEIPRHPMGVVVQRTGLTPHVLRAWERRYGAVRPGRTEGGQRLYSDADVARLRLLKRATEGGRAIGVVATLSTDAVARLVGEDRAESVETGAGAGAGRAVGVGVGAGDGASGSRSGAAAEQSRAACLEAADRLDGVELRNELMRAVVKLSVWEFVSGVVVPLLVRVGALWERGSLRPAQEHVVSAAVRQVLDWLLAGARANEAGPLLVVGTPEGELHEFGAMLAGVVAVDAGWRVLYLGPSLPAAELMLAAERSGAEAVAVSVIHEAGPGVREALATLRGLLAPEVSLLVGGGKAEGVVPDGAALVRDLGALREKLADLTVPEADRP